MDGLGTLLLWGQQQSRHHSALLHGQTLALLSASPCLQSGQLALAGGTPSSAAFFSPGLLGLSLPLGPPSSSPLPLQQLQPQQPPPPQQQQQHPKGMGGSSRLQLHVRLGGAATLDLPELSLPGASQQEQQQGQGGAACASATPAVACPAVPVLRLTPSQPLPLGVPVTQLPPQWHLQPLAVKQEPEGQAESESTAGDAFSAYVPPGLEGWAGGWAGVAAAAAAAPAAAAQPGANLHMGAELAHALAGPASLACAGWGGPTGGPPQLALDFPGAFALPLQPQPQPQPQPYTQRSRPSTNCEPAGMSMVAPPLGSPPGALPAVAQEVMLLQAEPLQKPAGSRASTATAGDAHAAGSARSLASRGSGVRGAGGGRGSRGRGGGGGGGRGRGRSTKRSAAEAGLEPIPGAEESGVLPAQPVPAAGAAAAEAASAEEAVKVRNRAAQKRLRWVVPPLPSAALLSQLRSLGMLGPALHGARKNACSPECLLSTEVELSTAVPGCRVQ